MDLIQQLGGGKPLSQRALLLAVHCRRFTDVLFLNANAGDATAMQRLNLPGLSTQDRKLLLEELQFLDPSITNIEIDILMGNYGVSLAASPSARGD